MELNRELFVLPHTKEEGLFLVYAPLEGRALKVGANVISLLQRVEKLEKIKDEEKDIIEQLKKQQIIFENGSQKIRQFPPINEYTPTFITLMPTLDCNLACTYCYSHGGEGNVKYLKIDAARAAIDFAIKNALKNKINEVTLGFHGGGEPLMPGAMPLVKSAVEYFRGEAKKNALKSRVVSATNATLRRKDLEWVIENIDRLTISLDGPKDIQDSQRPMRGPKGKLLPSFDKILENINYMNEHDFDYGIRSTITKKSVGRMSEIVATFFNMTTAESYHLEPMFKCGRCKTSGEDSPDAEEFIVNFQKARELAEKLGVSVNYSGSRIGHVSDKFCGAVGSNFFLTPEGIVTSCLEECRSDDPSAGTFFIGRYNSDRNEFEMDNEKVRFLQTRTVDKVKGCENCFIKYDCAGNCPKKAMSSSGSIFDSTGNESCLPSIMLSQIELERIVK